MNDFIFGTLATEELRRERVQSLRAGVTHNFRRSPIDPQPAQPITFQLSLGPAFPGNRAWIYWTTDGSDPDGSLGQTRNGHSAPLTFERAEWDTELWGYISHFAATLPGQPAGTLLRYRIGAEITGQGEVFADRGAFHAVYIDDDPLPDWTRDAVVYEIFVDRFNPGGGKPWRQPESLGGFFGGTLAGITEKLDYLGDLGVTVLWLTPIFPSPSHHGYDTTDLFAIEPRLGSRDDLRELLDQAHARGMRVLLDLVPNHVSDLHPIFQSAATDPASPYRDWFTFTHWPDLYESFFGVKSMPQLNFRNPQARQHMLDAARYWLEFGVDGFRVDYAIGPAPDFWADFRRVTRAVKPDCWTFGEIVDPSDVQLTFAGQLDGALDFILLEAIRQTIAFGRWGATRFASFLERHQAFFPADFSRPSFLDNHDMNRFLWAAENDPRKLRLAAACQFGLIGPPVIYYGTEIGLSQERDVRQGTRGIPEESRLPMPWEQPDRELLRFYQTLIALRANSPALRRGDLRTIAVGEHTLRMERRLGMECIQVALNLGDHPANLDLPAGFDLLIGTDSGVRGSQNQLGLPAFGAAILRKKE